MLNSSEVLIKEQICGHHSFVFNCANLITSAPRTAPMSGVAVSGIDLGVRLVYYAVLGVTQRVFFEN